MPKMWKRRSDDDGSQDLQDVPNETNTIRIQLEVLISLVGLLVAVLIAYSDLRLSDADAQRKIRFLCETIESAYSDKYGNRAVLKCEQYSE